MFIGSVRLPSHPVADRPPRLTHPHNICGNIHGNPLKSNSRWIDSDMSRTLYCHQSLVDFRFLSGDRTQVGTLVPPCSKGVSRRRPFSFQRVSAYLIQAPVSRTVYNDQLLQWRQPGPSKVGAG